MDASTAAACASETRAFCAREADLLALLETTRATNDDRVRARRQRVRECLVDRADELSPVCVSALVGNVATAQRVLPIGAADDQDHQETNVAGQTQPTVVTPDDSTNHHEDATTTAPSTEDERAPTSTKPVIVKLPPQEYTTAPAIAAAPRTVVQQPQYVQTSGDMETGIEVRIFLVNHPGQAIAAAPPAITPTYVRIGGDANVDTSGTGGATVAATTMSPWLWVMILPFMCIGMYVSAVQTITFVRRRRDVVYRVGASQYMPIPTSLNATKQ